MNLLQPLKLLLPALIPSWKFFDSIAPSPRIQYSLLNSDTKQEQEWFEFRPRPAELPFIKMLKRMLWNPAWNESLFLVSCAERIMQHYTEHSENEILQRIEKDLAIHPGNNSLKMATHLQFRLLIIQRKGVHLHEEVMFISRIHLLSSGEIT